MTMRSEISAVVVAALLAAVPGMQVQTDINLPFDTPSDATWAQIWFVEGAQSIETMGGVGNSLERGPVLTYVNIYAPKGSGDGEADSLATVVKNALRRLTVTDARWERFEGSPEGFVNGEWRKQIVAVFLRSVRV